jgi:hypothetical protein
MSDDKVGVGASALAVRLRQPSALLVAYGFILLIGLLAPFEFYTRNRVTWQPLDHALDFPAVGVVRSVAPPRRLQQDVVSGQGFAVEVWLRSRTPHQVGPARVVSYSADTRGRNFTLGQQGNALIVRLRTTETDLNGTPALEVAGVFAANVLRHIVVTYDFHILCAYVDGRREACRTSPDGRLENWDPGHHLLLGNETTGNRPWLGTLYFIALYNRALSAADITATYAKSARSQSAGPPAASQGLIARYGFGEGSGDTVRDGTSRDPIHLTIPLFVEARRHGFLSSASTLSRITLWSIADVVLNVLMFVPFGILCRAVLRQHGWRYGQANAATIGIAAVFALGVESAQYFIVSRASQREDVVLNVLGAGVGLLILFAADRSKLRRRC